MSRATNRFGMWGPAIALLVAFLLGMVVFVGLTDQSVGEFELRAPIALKTGNPPTQTNPSDGGVGTDTDSNSSVVESVDETAGSDAVPVEEGADESEVGVTVVTATAMKVNWFDTNFWRLLGWGAVLVAAAGLFWKIFAYLNDSRDDYYEAHEKAVSAGFVPQPIVAAITVAIEKSPAPRQEPQLTIPGALSRSERGKFEDVDLQIEGPGQIEVGHSGVFTIKAANGGPLPESLAFGVEPKTTKGKASVFRDPKDSGTFVVVGDKPGNVTLVLLSKSTVLDELVTIEVVPVAKPASSGTSIPLMVFGTGSHTLILVTLVVLVLLMLTLSGAISGEAAAPIIGTLIGYLFGVNVKSDAGGEKETTPAS